MSDKKTTIKKEVEDTMACSAYAEAGIPCPISSKTTKPEGKQTEPEEKPTLESVKNTMACSAFAEAGEPCPLDKQKK